MSNERTVEWCERLYAAKAAGLVLYGRALGLSHGEAEDVLQETFIALLAMETVPDEPEHYCMRSYRNRSLNYKRTLWRRLTRELESQRWFEPNDGETDEERLAMDALTQLPPPQREVIVLKLWNRLTFEEIGGLLEISPNTAAGRYRYGVERLRTLLRGKDHERIEAFGRSDAILEAAPALREA